MLVFGGVWLLKLFEGYILIPPIIDVKKGHRVFQDEEM